MATGARFVLPYQTVIDDAGVPIPGALLFFYLSGTSTPENTYSDSALTIPNTNPVVADAGGRFGNIFMIPGVAYKVVLEDSNGDMIWTADPVVGLEGTPNGTLATINVHANTNLTPGNSYGFETSLGTYTGFLPAISTLQEGATIWVLDVDLNAAINNITIDAAGADQIDYFASSSGTLTIDENGGGVMLIVRNNAWRALPLTGV